MLVPLVASDALSMKPIVPWAKPHQLLVVVVVMDLVVLDVVVVVLLKEPNRPWDSAPTIDPEAEADCPDYPMVFARPDDQHQH